MNKERAIHEYRCRLQRLAAEALQHGIVLTLKEEPLQPLAMGHHALRAEARVANAVYRGREPLSWAEERLRPLFPAVVPLERMVGTGCTVCGRTLANCVCGLDDGHPAWHPV